TDKPIQAADFRTAIERAFEAKFGAYGAQYFNDIVGAAACRNGHPCDLSQGIVADNAARTVTFRLTRPDGDFLSKLALTAAYAVPVGTPPPVTHEGELVPATGPYKIASYHKGHSLTLVRNRRFKQWSADAQPAGYPKRIVFTFFSPSGSGSTEARL